ncbi:uncharacterized protein LOC121984627 [Zingiber officinale]|uniref:PWWP domain-containing protein n=1 Tax=Zingiber officinale TaxID=94328 RepID=A0A8J5L7G5_ZINOF|nr:uncharacterized protein LOC121984627 [Zingiber officinale]XP_042393603.1 uncharacterized protein LOC121984627 [Zingiber officinale]KAG6503635.1 hypothetical protein ZIOFF_035952 [Zingiber officinale]
MDSRLTEERTTGLDLNAGELEQGSSDSGAELVSDTGGEVSTSAECLVFRNSEGSVLAADGVADCSDAAEITESLRNREEKQSGTRNPFFTGCEADHTPERNVVETLNVLALDVEGEIKPAEFEKSGSEVETFEKLESSLTVKTSLENAAHTDNSLKGRILLAGNEIFERHLASADESEVQGKVEMYYMERAGVSKTAEAMNAHYPCENKNKGIQCSPCEANFNGEKDECLKNEDEAELVEEDTRNEEKQDNMSNVSFDNDSVASALQDKVLDSVVLEHHSRVGTCKPEISTFGGAHDLGKAEPTTFDLDGDGVEIAEDTPCPEGIKVEISEFKNQTECKEEPLSDKVWNQKVDELTPPDEHVAVSVVDEPEKRAFGDGKLESKLVDTECSSGSGSSANHAFLEADKLEVQVNTGDECMEASDGIELSGDPEKVIQVANDDSEMGLGTDALDAAAEADGAPSQILLQDGNAIKLPQDCLSSADKIEGLQKEAVNWKVVNELCHGTEVSVVGSSVQNEGSTHSVLTDDMEVVSTDNHYKESVELDRPTVAGESSMLHSSENNTFGTEMTYVDLIQNDHDEESSIQQKHFKKVGVVSSDGDENNQVNNDKINSDMTGPIMEVNISEKDPLGEYIPDVSFMISTESDADIDIQVVEVDTGDIHLLEEAHMIERVSGAETETEEMEIDRWNMKNNESSAAVNDSISNPQVLMSKNQFVVDEKLSVGDARVSSSNLVLEAKSDQDMMIDEELSNGNKQTVAHVAAEAEISIEDIGQHTCYSFPSKDEYDFTISDLVWGKVKSHPWWPGQIFDVSDASDLALKYQKKDNFLVAYFGDKTFAWCDESQLKHFEIHFPQLEKQSTSDVFTSAVDGTLDEFSRRIGLGMTCFCLPEVISINCQKVENAGVRKGSNGYLLDRPSILSYFEPVKLLEYIKNLAQFPDYDTDRLSLVLANAQLKALYRSKGYPELPSFNLFDGGIIDCDDDISHLNSESIGKDLFEQSCHILCDSGEQRSRGHKKQKHVLEDGKKQKSLSELMLPEDSQLENGVIIKSFIEADHDSVPCSSSKRHKIIDIDSSDSARSKKRRPESIGDMEMCLPSPAIKSSFKVGEYIRRVASQLTGSSSNLRTSNEASLKVCKGDSVYDDFASDSFGDTTMESPSFELDDSEYYASPNEMFLLLHLAARDPIEGYDYLSSLISFFTKFRNYCVSSSASEEKHLEEERAEKDKKRRVEALSVFSEMIETDHMMDSYWSDLISHNRPTKIEVEVHAPAQRKKRKTSRQTSALISVPVVQATEHIQIGIACPTMKQVLSSDRPIISVNAKIVDRCMPTALVLNFNKSSPLPSEVDLIRIFCRYGPIVEVATEVQQESNSVKLIFKRITDAEMAFSSARKYGWFGPSLLSYHLRYLSSTPDTFADIQQSDNYAALPEHSNLETPGNDSDSNLKNKCDAVSMESLCADIPCDHPSVSNAYIDTNSQNQSELVFAGNGRTDTTAVLHTSASDTSPNNSLLMQSDTAITEESKTDFSGDHLSVSVASPDSDVKNQDNAVLVQSNTDANLPRDIHPPTSNICSDTDLQDKYDTVSDIILQENSDALVRSTDSDIHNELHPCIYEVLPDNLDDKGDAVMIESRPVASLDSDILNQGDAVPLDSDTNDLPCDLHSPIYDTSADTNLQEKHETVSDTTISDVIVRDCAGIHSELRASISDAPILNDLHAKSDALLIERSVTSLDFDVQTQSDVVLNESSTISLPCDRHPLRAGSSQDLHEKCETVSNINIDENSNLVVRDDNNSDSGSQHHASLPDAVLIENSEIQLPGSIHPSFYIASTEAGLQCESDPLLTESSNVSSSNTIHGSTLDASPYSEP